MNKRNKKIIIIVCMLLVLLINIIPMDNVFGAINPDNNENIAVDWVKNVIGSILSVGLGALGAPIASLVNAILLIIVLLLQAIFAPVSATLFPMPDEIIFNKLAFFDPNFINLPTYSSGPINNIFMGSGTAFIEKAPVYILRDVIQDLYYTSFILAGAIFAIAAMVIGIKLALSTIASEKAHYKEALTNWIKGIIILFFAHFIILGVFTINEQIVHTISKTAKGITFSIDIAESIPLVGSSIGKLVSGIASLLNDFTGGIIPETKIDVNGYFGLVLKFIGLAIGRRLISFHNLWNNSWSSMRTYRSIY